MVRVSTCCGCCGLKIGLYVYGIIILILRVLGFVSLFVSKEQQAHAKSFGGSTYVSACFIVIAVVLLIFALVGVQKEKPNYLIPYMVILVLEIVLGTITFLWATFAISPLYLLVILIGICPEIYAFICLWSHYQDLKEQRFQPPPAYPYDTGMLATKP